MILDLYKLQTIFHEESGPNTLDFEEKKFHITRLMERSVFFKTLISTVKPNSAKKKTFLDNPHFDFTNLVKRSQLGRVSYNCVTNYANFFFFFPSIL